jgi:hypothetical protein
MPPDQTTSASMYCRQCGYQLAGLSQSRCPECGRPFDPRNPRTFLRWPRSWTVRRWIHRAEHTLLGGLIGIGLLIGGLWLYLRLWCYPEWKSEQPIIAAIKRIGGRANSGLRPAWPAHVPLGWLGWEYRDRVKSVDLSRFPSDSVRRLSAENLEQIATLGHLEQLGVVGYQFDPSSLKYVTAIKTLRSLRIASHTPDAKVDTETVYFKGLTNLTHLELTNTDLSDNGLQHLEGMTQLESLILFRAHVTDTGLGYLKRMTGMRELHLAHTAVTDAGMPNLAGMTQMRTLYLSYTGVGDAGLTSLKGMTRLELLDLRDTQVSDAGLAYLTGLTSLRSLDLVGTRVTRHGVEQLKQSLPSTTITSRTMDHGP